MQLGHVAGYKPSSTIRNLIFTGDFYFEQDIYLTYQ